MSPNSLLHQKKKKETRSHWVALARMALAFNCVFQTGIEITAICLSLPPYLPSAGLEVCPTRSGPSFYKIYFMCTTVLPACMSMQGCQIHWNWSCRQFWAALWVLGIKPRYSGRTASMPNCWAISPAPTTIMYLCSLNLPDIHKTSLKRKTKIKNINVLNIYKNVL